MIEQINANRLKIQQKKNKLRQGGKHSKEENNLRFEAQLDRDKRMEKRIEISVSGR